MQRTVLIITTLFLSANAAGGGSKIGSWQFPATNPCIMLKAQIDLDLTYVQTGTDGEPTGHFTVPSASKIAPELSNCSVDVIVNNDLSPVHSQVLGLALDHLDGWYLQLFFTTDERLQTDGGKQWALYMAKLQANYATMPDVFPNPQQTTPYIYVSDVSLGGDTQLAEYLYANKGHSFSCPNTPQKFILHQDSETALPWDMSLSQIKMQAFVDPGNDWGTADVCPADQRTTDKVPLIVGGSLAGLIVLVTVLYLIYRACLPKEIITLVNPDSHFDNKAMRWDEEETETAHSSDNHSHHSQTLHV